MIILKFSRQPYIHNFYVSFGISTGLLLNNAAETITYENQYLENKEVSFNPRTFSFGLAFSIGYLYTPYKMNYSFYIGIGMKLMVYFEKIKSINHTKAETYYYKTKFPDTDGAFFPSIVLGIIFRI